jgi:hypothetical protein
LKIELLHDQCPNIKSFFGVDLEGVKKSVGSNFTKWQKVNK